jgi:hypothetical protein
VATVFTKLKLMSMQIIHALTPERLACFVKLLYEIDEIKFKQIIYTLTPIAYCCWYDNIDEDANHINTHSLSLLWLILIYEYASKILTHHIPHLCLIWIWWDHSHANNIYTHCQVLFKLIYEIYKITVMQIIYINSHPLDSATPMKFIRSQTCK